MRQNLTYDDYLQYAPAVVMMGLKTFGVESRNSWGRMLVSDAFSVALMATAVNTIKHTTKIMRPDGSSRNSFPSGHSATAFMTATMLHKEYGLTRSAWYSVGGYTVAAATAISRQLNNRHWLSDIMVGAGIGIFSTELGYFFADLIFKDKGIKHHNLTFEGIEEDRPPSFFGYGLGFTVTPNGYQYITNDLRIKSSTGSTAGFEGAYFFNKYIGVGGRARVSSIPISVDDKLYFKQNPTYDPNVENIQPALTNISSIDAGAYFSYPLTNRWLVGSKFLVGTEYSPGSKITAFYRESKDDVLKSKDLIDISEFHSISVSTGTSLSYIVKRNLAVRLLFDYSLLPTHLSFKVNRYGQNSEPFKASHFTHVLTLGASVNLQF
ncbi:MAG: phosphatase PAP2 family protein [Bacteroidaceae bacterium]